MTTKTILISSLGLRNLVTSNFTEDSDFYMIFGEKKIRMNTIYAEFISPIVSKLHQTDITARSIKFDDSIPIKTDDFIQFSSEILTPDVIELFMRISSGNPIEIDDRQAFKLRFLSIIIGNEELFTIINDNFPPDFDENNVSTYLECIQCCYHYSHFAMDFDFSSIINYIASNFYKVDPDEFLKIPRKIQYAIITNSNLKIKSEDSLFIIIDQIIKNKKDNEIEDISFLEQIEFSNLSEENLRFFFSSFDINQITNSIWMKLYKCCFKHFNNYFDQTESLHSIKENTIDYIENETDRFDGIINYLTKKCGGNVDERGICKVTSSPVYNNYTARNVVEFSNDLPLSTLVQSNAWVKYDFKDRKVRPTFYSIRTPNKPSGNSHLKNWVIEGSNTDNESDWKILDSRNDINCLNYSNAENTFVIENSNEFYRYLRLRQTGPNARNNYNLYIAALEFFGSIILN